MALFTVNSRKAAALAIELSKAKREAAGLKAQLDQAIRDRDEARTELAKVKPPAYCNFCGKDQYEVMHLIAGPKVFICDECVDLCTGVVREAREKEG
ncbi:ClpX C4-type zinc finger protein [Paracoccus pantotrophus]|uniref:ClpX C4-type zinc finger protein n=1 Tax=Paracoccus pantotrophus TaxID=82367 RepID=A0AAE6NZF5_PARPN|nr:hypothetical protein ESD82_18655 [Paracoccus pantotrophus]RKS51427.1 ClpX C4-type zinc finger protein [Paracoccus pantotrophus]